ncbi:MAG: hypothetical protein K0V04_39085, partial [Deltaproteobacteria bacterium]|nr:hypothetical protein [Deltaproteobacteria bacterium]
MMNITKSTQLGMLSCMLSCMLSSSLIPACAPCEESRTSLCGARDASQQGREAETPVVNGYSAIRIDIDTNDTFEKVGDVWVRRSFTGGIRYTFEEVDRDEWSVFLHDESRDRTVILDLHTRNAHYRDDNEPLTVFSSIVAAYDTHKAVNGLNTNRVEIHSGDGAFQNYGAVWHELDQDGEVVDTFTECGRFDLLVCVCKPQGDGTLMLEMNLLTRKASYWDNGYTFLSDIYDASDIILTEPDPGRFGGLSGSTSDPRIAIHNAGHDFLPHLRDASWMQSVFGEDYDQAKAASLATMIEQGELSWLPEIHQFPAASSRASIKGVTIGHAVTGQPTQLDGAYKNGTVYWNDALTGPDANELAARMVAVQELAHHFDLLLNPRGLHTGGEGVIAVSQIYGIGEDHASTLTDEQLTRLRRYRDHVDIEIDGMTIYGAELGFREWVIGAVSVVVVVATLGTAAPEVAAADAALLAGDLVVEEAAAEGAALLTEETAAALEVAGEATEVVEGAAAPTVESLLGGQYTGEIGSVSGAELEAVHATLEEQGYRFVGYSGTTLERAVSAVNEGLTNPGTWSRTNPWAAFYIADDAGVAAGYTATEEGGFEGGQLLRVYLPTADANALQNIGVALDQQASALSEIETAVGTDAWTSGNYVIRGVATTDQAGTETIVGWTTAERAVLVPSSIGAPQSLEEVGMGASYP